MAKSSTTIEYMSALEGFAKGRLVLSTESAALGIHTAAAAAASSPFLSALSCDAAVIDGIVLAISDHVAGQQNKGASTTTTTSTTQQQQPFVNATFNVLTNLLTSTSLPITNRVTSSSSSSSSGRHHQSSSAAASASLLTHDPSSLLAITLELGNNYRIWCLVDAILKTTCGNESTSSSSSSSDVAMGELQKLIVQNLAKLVTSYMPFAALNPLIVSAARNTKSEGTTTMMLTEDARCVFVTATQLYMNVLNSWLVVAKKQQQRSTTTTTGSFLLLPPDTRRALEGHISFVLDSIAKQSNEQQKQQQQRQHAKGGAGNRHHIDQIRNTTQQLLSSFQQQHQPQLLPQHQAVTGVTAAAAMNLSGQRLVNRFIEQLFAPQRLRYSCQHCGAFFSSETARNLHNRLHFYYRTEPCTRCFGATLHDFVSHDQATVNAAATRIVDEHVKRHRVSTDGDDAQADESAVPAMPPQQLQEKLEELFFATTAQQQAATGQQQKKGSAAAAAQASGLMFVPLFVPTSKVTQKPDMCFLNLRTHKKGKRTEREL